MNKPAGDHRNSYKILENAYTLTASNRTSRETDSLKVKNLLIKWMAN